MRCAVLTGRDNRHGMADGLLSRASAAAGTSTEQDLGEAHDIGANVLPQSVSDRFSAVV